MPRRFNALDVVRDLEIHGKFYVVAWSREKLAQVKAVWDERNPAHEIYFKGTKGEKFTGAIEWREK